MNKGWHKDYHRHYLAAKYGEAPGKINMRSGGDLIAASNALGQRLSISNAMDEGTKVIPAAIELGKGTNAKSRNAGFYETDAANHTATHYLAKEGHVDAPKYKHVPWLKTKKQIEAFEEKTGRKHDGESAEHYLNREVTDEVDEEKEPELYMARKLSSSSEGKKEEGVFETTYGNSAAVSFEDGKWHAYDLDMGQAMPVSMVTKQRIRDLDPGEGSLWEDDDHEYTGD